MKFDLKDVEIRASSLGIFGTGEKITMIHIPSGLKVQRIEVDRFIRHKEKLAMVDELRKKVEEL